MESADWTVVVGSHWEGIDGAVECLTDYLNFCMDAGVPVRTVRCYANNKPWVTSEVKAKKKKEV